MKQESLLPTKSHIHTHAQVNKLHSVTAPKSPVIVVFTQCPTKLKAMKKVVCNVKLYFFIMECR